MPHQNEAAVRNLQGRVVCVSFCLLANLVLMSLVNIAYDTATLTAAFNQIGDIVDVPEEVSQGIGTQIAFNGFSNILGAFFIGIVVTLCGCIGAREGKQHMVGCFCCWNAFSSCCGILSMCVMFLMMLATGTGAPGLESFLQRCDAAQVCADTNAIGNRSQLIVDCIAPAMWTDYDQQFTGNAKLPVGCPPIFLNCDTNISDAVDSHDDQFLRGPDSSQRFDESWSVPHAGQFMGMSLPMPADILTQCIPQEDAIHAFHQVSQLVPELAPKMVAYMTAKVFLLIPTIVLACCGFCLGKDLYFSLQSGHVPHVLPITRAVSVQPALGTTGYQRADVPMVEPLMRPSAREPAQELHAMEVELS